jgi:RimJ/RimL family protein N-acetyltransferase
LQNNKICIKGNGFDLRTWQYWDEDSLQKNANNKKVSQYLFDSFPYPYTIKDAKQWIKENNNFIHNQLNLSIDVDWLSVGGVWIVRKEGNNALTWIYGYWLGEEYRNKWIISEATQIFLDFIFQNTELLRIEASVFQWNDYSVRVLNKLWFLHEGTLRNNIYKDWKIYNEEIYSILKEEWINRLDIHSNRVNKFKQWW